MIVDTPEAIPVTSPDTEPMLMLLLPLVQMPPNGAPVSDAVDPVHTLDGAVIDGRAFTVTFVVMKQPAGEV